MMKKVYGILLFLHFFVGIGAMSGGLMAILFPQGPAGMPDDALKYSPFSNYLIPGIILFAVIGLGNVYSAISILIKSKYQGYISSFFSCALVIWIIVQCVMLRAVVHLHIIFFIIGIVEALLSAILLLHQRLFPTRIIFTITRKLVKKFPENKLVEILGKLEKL